MILRESGPRSHWRRLLVFEPRITVRGTNENRRGTDWRSVLPSIGIRTLAAYTLRNRAYHDSLTRPKSSHRLASRVTLSALSFPLWRWCTLSLSFSLLLLRASSFFVFRSAHSERRWQRRRGWCTRAKEWSVDRLYEERKEFWWQKREEESMAVSLRGGRTWIWVIGADANAVRRNSVSSVYFRGTGGSTVEEEGRSRRWEEGNRWWRRRNWVGERGV